jgi:4-oxalocrotonate tautomerase
VVSVEGERLRPLTLVIIDDNVKSGDWGIGGKGATTEMLRDIRAGEAKPPAAA